MKRHFILLVILLVNALLFLFNVISFNTQLYINIVCSILLTINCYKMSE